MSITISASPGTSSRPLAQLLVNGGVPTGSQLISCSIRSTNYGEGDQFEADIALAPNAAPWFDPPINATGTVTPIDASIQFAFATGSAAPAWTTMIRGEIDQIQISPTQALLHTTGRDYTAKLRDLSGAETWLNNTGTQILNTLIAYAGLTADVQIPNDSMSGAFYTTQHKRMRLIGKHRFANAYDLVRFVVNSAGCDLWAEGKTIKVRPRKVGVPSRTIAYVRPGGQAPWAVVPAMQFTLERDLLVSKGIVVSVISWDSRQRARHQYFWSKKGGSANPPPSSTALVYGYTPAGLSDAQVQIYAQRRYFEIVAHTRVVKLTEPGDLTTTPRQSIAIQGTGLSYDGTLAVDEVSREWSVDSGFTQSVVLRNRDEPPDDGSDAG